MLRYQSYHSDRMLNVSITGDKVHFCTEITGVDLDQQTILKLFKDIMFGNVIDMLKSMDVDWEEIEKYIESRKIVKKLILLRVKGKLTQKDLAKLANRSIEWVQKIEKGSLSAFDLKIYCDVLGIQLL